MKVDWSCYKLGLVMVIIGLFMIVFMGSAQATILTQFDDGTTEKNLTFHSSLSDSATLKSFSFELPKYLPVKSAYFNLTGVYGLGYLDIETSSSYIEPTPGYTGSVSNFPYAYDESWSNYFQFVMNPFGDIGVGNSWSAFIYQNYTLPSYSFSGDYNLTNKWGSAITELYPFAQFHYIIALWDFTSSSWVDIYNYKRTDYHWYTTYTTVLGINSYISNNKLATRHQLLIGNRSSYSYFRTATLRDYEEKIDFYVYPHGISSDIGSFNLFNENGNHTTKNSSIDFSEKLNFLLYSCSMDGNGNCTITINVSSDCGMSQINNLRIDYSESYANSFSVPILSAERISSTTITNWSSTYISPLNRTSTVTFRHYVEGINKYNQTFSNVINNSVLNSSLHYSNYTYGDNVSVIITAVSENMSDITTTNYTLVNSPPSFTQYNFSTSVSRIKNITIQLNASDVDGDSIFWYMNSTEFDINQSGFINKTITISPTKGYNLSITANDTYNDSTNIWVFINFVNDAPIIDNACGNVTIFHNVDLNCTYNLTDVEGDTITSYINDTRINLTSGGLNPNISDNPSLSDYNIDEGCWNISFNATDGTDWVYSSFMYCIDNTAPSIDDYCGNTTIFHNFDLNCTYNLTDAEGDTITSYINDTRINLSAMGYHPNVSDNPSLSDYNIDEGCWNISFNATDSVSWSYSSFLYCIDNTAPSINDYCIDTTMYYNESFNCTYNLTDAEGDTITSYINDTRINLTAGGLHPNVSDFPALSDYNMPGCWNISFNTTDSISWSYSSFLYCINNSPAIISVFTNMTVNHSENDILGWCNASDINLNNITYYYKWFRNGSIHTASSSGPFVSGTEVNVANMSYTNTFWNDEWVFECKPHSSGTFGTAVNSSNITISIGAPTFSVDPIINNTSPYSNDTILCDNGTYYHPEGTAKGGQELRWKDNGVIIPGETSQVLNLTLAGLVYFDNITCESRVNDSIYWSQWYSSDTATINNTLAIVGFVSLNVTSTSSSNTYICVGGNATDLDLDNVTYHFSFYDYEDNLLQAESTNDTFIVSSGEGTHGDAVVCKVRAYDGFDYSLYYNDSTHLRMYDITYTGTHTVNEIILISVLINNNSQIPYHPNISLISPLAVLYPDLTLAYSNSTGNWEYSFYPNQIGSWVVDEMYVYQDNGEAYYFEGDGDTFNINAIGGGGDAPSGGGGSSSVRTLEPLINLTGFCGDGKCDDDETAWGCPEDCKINYDTLFTCLWDEDIECNWEQNWFVTFLITSMLGLGIIAIFIYEKKSKR